MTALRDLASRPLVQVGIVLFVVGLVGDVLGSLFSRSLDGAVFTGVFTAVVGGAGVVHLGRRHPR